MFAQKLLDWYAEQGRNLPWRGTSDPYRIWLSEIILQQTRIEQGWDYYERFLAEYPTIQHLAAASEQQVLKTWQGLGYYSRARNMHNAAQYIVNELGGQFPETYEGILALKGVGRYTAAAIASFAYRLPYPVIDGNVYRLIARLYGIYTPIATDAAYREFEALLLKLIDRRRPDLFNQAIMDFGSIWCKPVGCDCEHCIFQQECVAHREGKVAMLPVKQPKVAVKKRYFFYLDIRWEEDGQEMTLMQQRESGDIWQGLYELPLYESDNPMGNPEATQATNLTFFSDLLGQWFGQEPDTLALGPAIQHQLTHRTICARFIVAKYSARPAAIPPKYSILSRAETKKLPVPRLIDRYLSSL